MKCKTILAMLACVVLAVILAGCGAFKGQTSDLKTISLTVSAINGAPVTGAGGTVTLQGLGGTLQLQATAEYTGGTTKDITHVAVYSAMVDPNNSSNGDDFGDLLIPPCQPPSCPVPVDPPYTNGTLEFSQTGLLTAVEPAECTWVNSDPDGTSPAWSFVGDYVVTVTYKGITSNPLYVPIGSAAGVVSKTNPTGSCGPTS